MAALCRPEARPLLEAQLRWLAEEGQEAVERSGVEQLKRLALTVDQLVYATHHRLVMCVGIELFNGGGMFGMAMQARLTASQAAFQAAADASVAALLALEPDNPWGWHAKVLHLRSRNPEESVQAGLRCFRLGKQQGSDWYVAQGAVDAMNLCSAKCLGVSPQLRRAAEEAFQEAKPALRRCKRLLPDGWVKVRAASASCTARMFGGRMGVCAVCACKMRG